MKPKGVEFFAGSVGGYVIYKILDYVEPQIVNAFLTLNGVSLLLLADLGFIGLMIFGIFLMFKNKYGWFRKSGKSANYIPNLQEYWNHISLLRKSIEDDINRNIEFDKQRGITSLSEIPDYFRVINQSDKKRIVLQHMITYFSYPKEEMSKIMLTFLTVHSAMNWNDVSQDLKNEFIKSFNRDFHSLFQLMIYGKPRLGMCDGCRDDYDWEDKDRCETTLNRFNEDKKGFIRQLMKKD